MAVYRKEKGSLFVSFPHYFCNRFLPYFKKYVLRIDCRSNGGMNTPEVFQRAALVFLSIFPLHFSLEALPKIDNVAHGTATSAAQGNELLIQPSNNAILNYRNFDIQGHETVRFEMQNPSHRVLNRIHGAVPTHIDGRLLSNGIVYLINQAGIVFGQGSVINVGALYAAAAHLSDQDFILGLDRFTEMKGVIEVYGTLSAQEIALIGRSVLQKGSLLAEDGNILLATAENVYLGKEGSHLFLKCQKQTLQEPEEAPCFIACGTPESFFLHHEGVTRAKKIHLYGEKESLIQVSGSLDANRSSGEGGAIVVQGEVISLEGARIEASGNTGGGEIFIGGGIRGEGLYPTATYTISDPATQIKADALESGNGGKVVLWADNLTTFEAKISAQGGSREGDGGYVETSSGNHFHGMQGHVNTSAPHGKWGEWDLDPHSITIINGSSVPPTLTLADLSDGTMNDYVASATLLESATSTIIMAAVVPNPVGGDNTYISLGPSMGASPATVNITNPNVGVTINTQNGVGNGVFYANGSFSTTGPLVISSPTVLKGDTTFTSTASVINFDFTIDSDTGQNYNLTLNAQAPVTLSGAIGSTQPVGVLDIEAPNQNILCFGNISATGDITFNSAALTLNAPCTFTSSGGGIEFVGVVNSDNNSSNRNLSLSAQGDILFDTSVGLSPLGDLSIARANNVTLFSQSDPTQSPYIMVVRSFTQTSGTGDTSFQGALITSGAPVAQTAGTPPSAPRSGGDVSITTNGAINFYYLVQTPPSTSLTPVLSPASTDNVVYKSVITTTGGRQSSSTSTVSNPNAPNGLSGGSVTLNGSTINLLGIYAGGTPAFPGTTGTGGNGGDVSLTSTGGTTLYGPIFATGGPGANGGAQDYPVMTYSGQNLSAAGSDSPGDITISGPLTLGFNGIILRGNNVTLPDVQSSGSNLLGIDASTAGTVALGALNNLSYFALDYAETATISGAVGVGGLALFNAGDGNITFEQAVTATDIQAIANDFCVIYEDGYSTGTSTLLNCKTCPMPPPPSPPPPSPPPPSPPPPSPPPPSPPPPSPPPPSPPPPSPPPPSPPPPSPPPPSPPPPSPPPPSPPPPSPPPPSPPPPSPPPPSPPPPSPPAPPPSPEKEVEAIISSEGKGKGFDGVYYPVFPINFLAGGFFFFPLGGLFGSDDSYLKIPNGDFFLDYIEPSVTTDSLK